MNSIRIWLCSGLLAFAMAYGQETLEYGVRYRIDGNASNNKIVTLSNRNVVVAWYREPGFHMKIFSSRGDVIQEIHLWTGCPTYRIIPLKTDAFFLVYRDSDNIKGILYSADGSVIKDVFTINSRVKINESDLDAGISVMENDDWICLYYGNIGADASRYYAQIISSTGEKSGDEMLVSGIGPFPYTFPKIIALRPDLFIILRFNRGWDEPDSLIGHVFGGGMTSIGSKIEVASNLDLPRFLSWISPGLGFRVYYQKYNTSGNTDIYTRFFSTARLTFSGEKNIAGYVEKAPALSSAGGRHALFWIQRYWPSYLLNATFGIDSTVGNTFQVGDNGNAGDVLLYNPVAGLSSDEGGIFAWIEQHNGQYGIVGQFISKTGEKIRHKFKIQDMQTYNESNDVRITVSPSGDMYVYWVEFDEQYATDTFYLKRYPETPVNRNLSEFRILQPANDAFVEVTNPYLFWERTTRQTLCYPWEIRYTLFIDDNPDFTSPQTIQQEQDTVLLARDLRPGSTYFWKVLARNYYGDSLWSANTSAFFVSHSATVGVEQDQRSLPDRLLLKQNYPNPFNPTTVIRFELPAGGFVDVSIFNISGKRVKVLVRESRNAGSYSVNWGGVDSSGNPVPSGIYVCRMEVRTTDNLSLTASVKMGLVR